MAERDNLIYGLHAVLAALRCRVGRVSELWVDGARQDARLTRVMDAARQAEIPLHRVTQRELDALAPNARHQGVVARCALAPAYAEANLADLIAGLAEPALLLILDGVQDPHNLGACLRSADAAGVHAVIVPRDRAVALTPAVRKVASGAAETVPFIKVTNLARTLRDLKAAGIWLAGAAEEAETELFDTDLRGPLALILGGEGGGLRRLTREHCDVLLRIPMAGAVESLNVSVATGVCLFEAARQRRSIQ